LLSPARRHDRNSLRWVPVVGSIDPPGRESSGHRPNLMIATRAHSLMLEQSNRDREIPRSFLRWGHAHPPPSTVDDREGGGRGQAIRGVGMQLVRRDIPPIVFIPSYIPPVVYCCNTYRILCLPTRQVLPPPSDRIFLVCATIAAKDGLPVPPIGSFQSARGPSWGKRKNRIKARR